MEVNVMIWLRGPFLALPMYTAQVSDFVESATMAAIF